MKTSLVIQRSTHPPIETLPFELVERKGLGHPDSLCDGIADTISQRYSKYCRKHFGLILHHNFDKVQLVAGRANAKFGGGSVERPITIQVAGRGTSEFEKAEIPVDTIAEESTEEYLKRTLRYFKPDNFSIRSFIGRGSADLTQLYSRSLGKKHTPNSNDTSFGFSHWPLSTLEKTVLLSENYISSNLRSKLRSIGEDVKVLGERRRKTIDVTVAVAVVDREIANLEEYLDLKETVKSGLKDYLEGLLAGRKINVDINCADDYRTESVYITVTGTSAENGDDGAVGRGNRLNGLITPFRGMSLEACAGKNPVSHVGKIYNVLALLTARQIVAHDSDVSECSVLYSSKIGDYIDEPRNVCVAVRPKGSGNYVRIRESVKEIVRRELEHIPDLTVELIEKDLAYWVTEW
jgi:S-adenosylmethionine synthetase